MQVAISTSDNIILSNYYIEHGDIMYLGGESVYFGRA